MTATGLVPVLWLCGPPGVGKTTVAWEFFTRLTRAGIPAGYVDIDQLGICYPAPTPDDRAPEPGFDPGRHRMKTRNLGEAVSGFRAAGARCVIVSGVVDADRGVDVELIPQAAVTVCRLRADGRELRRRLAGRGRPDDQPDEALLYADALDRNGVADLCVDTTGRSVSEVIRRVGEGVGGWPPASRWLLRPRPDRAASGGDADRVGSPTAPGEILWVCGATGVGKSTVGWQVWEDVRRAGSGVTAFVDLDQIGFCRPVPADDPRNHRVKAANLAGIWQIYHAIGVRRMVVVGPVDHPDVVSIYWDALHDVATLRLCRLHASGGQLARRIALRGQGGGPQIPGDALVGQPMTVLRRVADDAAAQADALARAAVGDVWVDTDGRSVADAARMVLHLVGWLT